MLISALAKEINVPSKDIIEFFKTHGSDYKHSNKMTPEEELLVREHFVKKTGAQQPDKKPATIIRKKQEKEPEELPKPAATTLIRRKGEQRNFVPEENRPAATELFTHDMSPANPAPVPAPETAPVTAELEKTQQEEVTAAAAIPPAESGTKEAEDTTDRNLTPENIIRKEIKALEEQSKATPARVVDIKKEDEDDPHHKKKKKIILVPETEEEKLKAQKKASNTRSGKKFKDTPDFHKIKTKITGADVQVLTEEESFARHGKYGRRKEKRHIPAPPQVPNPTKAIKKIIKIENSITVGEFARRMGLKSAELIKKMFEMGEMVGINDRVNMDIAGIVAIEFGFQVENVALSEDTYIERVENKEEDLVPRPPVVTVMGHVDHGKTKLLDAIRNTNVVDKEAGGITQHIGAYTVELEKGSVTFLDTPGHEAFTAMRSRGAQATDIVILIVAADDGVMPQTVEAINHAKAAKVPIIVAINKIDKPDANPEKVRQELLKYEIVPEEWGGDNFFVEISAKQKLNIDKLLETVLLQVEMMELKANPNKPGESIVIESKMDLGKGPVATTLIKDGTLKVGDLVATAHSVGYIRSMIDWKGNRVEQAGPSMAVEITGLDSVPPAGEMLYVFKDEKNAKGFVDLRKNKMKEQRFEREEKVSLENLFSKIEQGGMIDLNVVLKGDVDGSVEAIAGALGKIEHDKVKIRIIHSGVGGITENDVLLASASSAVIVGFNVRIDNKAKQIAQSEKVDIRIFSIIYELIDSIKGAMTGLLSPIIKEEYTGKAEIRQVFKVSKVGSIAGCMVVEGRIVRKCRIKLVRENVVIYEGTISSLKRFKDDVREVKNGYECGITIDGYNEIKEGDFIECYIDQEFADEVK